MILLLTLMLLVLLTFEVATISLVAQRGLGEEGMLSSQSIEARRAAEVALNRLQQNLNTYLLTNTPAQAATAFASGGGSDLTPAVMTTTNPGTSAIENTDTTISAWLVERRGYWFHLVGRAQVGSVDIMEHRWVMLNPCNSQAGSLSTIISAIQSPGIESTVVASDGRVYFSQDTSPGNVWTWKTDTGLSTILSTAAGFSTPGEDTMTIDPNDRVFFGTGGPVFTYTPATGLSTIFTSANGVDTSSVGVGNDGRFFFGEDASPGNFWTWKVGTGAGTGLSTILPAKRNHPGMYDTVVEPNTSRVYFGEATAAAGLAWSWQASTGLSTMLPFTLYHAFYHPNPIAASDGRVMIAEEDTGAPIGALWTWKPGAGEGLSTIPIGTAPYTGFDEPSAENDWLITNDNRFYFSNWAGPGNLWSWKEGVGLSTIISGGAYIGKSASDMAADGRIFVGENANPGNFYTYLPATGLSTIVSAVKKPGYDNTRDLNTGSVVVRHFATPSGRVFFGEYAFPGKFWTWKSTTGLSTIMTSVLAAGSYASLAVTPNERMYVGEQGDGAGNTGHVWTWAPTTGLSTLAGVAATDTGDSGTAMATPDGSMYMGGWGQAGDLSPMLYWKPPADCSNRPY